MQIHRYLPQSWFSVCLLKTLAARVFESNCKLMFSGGDVAHYDGPADHKDTLQDLHILSYLS